MTLSRILSSMLASIALLGISASVYAQTQMVRLVESRFDAADADKDGKLTKAEAENGMPRVAHEFDHIDTEHKGYVTKEQILAYLAKQKL